VIALGSIASISPGRRVVALGLTAVGVVAMAWRFGWSPPLPAYLTLGVLAGIVAVTDATQRRIPAIVVLPAYPIAAALLAMACALEGSWWSLGRAAFAGVAVALFYLVLALIFPGSLGLGDVRLGGLLGGYLGFLGWTYVTTGVLFGWLLGTCFVLVVRHGTPRRHVRLPFGPFLLAGALIVIVATK
jgi:leader peptidase (prepilin peptidase)/N-methyltransferase